MSVFASRRRRRRSRRRRRGYDCTATFSSKTAELTRKENPRKSNSFQAMLYAFNTQSVRN